MVIQPKAVHNSTTSRVQVSNSKELLEQVTIHPTLQMVSVLLVTAIMGGATLVEVGR